MNPQSAFMLAVFLAAGRFGMGHSLPADAPAARAACHLIGKPGYNPVWNPLNLKCAPASGPDRKSINAFAASADGVPTPTPPVNKVRLPRSAGNGPTNCTP